MNIFRVKARLLLLILTLLLSSGGIYSQNGNAKITINRDNISVEEALREIEKQTGLSVAYNQSKLKDAGQLNLNIDNQSLNEVMNLILNKTGFTYEIKDDQIMIIPEKKQQNLEKRTIKGSIVDETGLPGLSTFIRTV